jgi:hypothetical protein
MRSLVAKLFDANEQHILDWYHIERRFVTIGKGLVYLPHIEDFEHRLSRHWHHLNRAKWKVWHGNLHGASIALSSLYDGVDIHVMIAEADCGRSTVVEQGSQAVGRIVVVPDRKPDTTDQLWQGIPRRPSRIDGVGGIDCGPTGGLADGEEAAHALDPTRRADVAPRALCANQRRTGQIHPVVALRIITNAGGGGMNPQVLSSPDFSRVRQRSPKMQIQPLFCSAEQSTNSFCALRDRSEERDKGYRTQKAVTFPARSGACSSEKRNKWRGPTKWGGGRLCRIRP